jgi:glucosamine-6-phosphate deaminase
MPATPATPQSKTAHDIPTLSAAGGAGGDLLTVHERLPTQVYAASSDVSSVVAREIADFIRTRAEAGKHAVLGLATGSTPTGVYAELVRMHQEEGLSFKNVITFNLDEYWPMKPDALQSYVRFMREHLFDHIDIPADQVNVPDGTVERDAAAAYCAGYEKKIRDAGGIDLQLLGIGRTGHIGFNEPGSGEDSRTRLIWLDDVTRIDAASDFFGIEHVPSRAITMGVGSILDARRVILMAFGESKSRMVARSLEEPVTAAVAASFLQRHPNATFFLDEAAAAGLTRFKTPWLVGDCDWTPRLIRTAVTWLATTLDKPILKLTDADYNNNHLQDLIAGHGPAYDINVSVFRVMQNTITGWPGGKPREADRPSRLIDKGADVFPKRCLIFSPHPDDDVISMGGTLIRLVDQGHDVHVAYQVSGSIAVFDEDALRFADFASDFAQMFSEENTGSVKFAKDLEAMVQNTLRHKEPGAADPEAVQRLKGLIRRGEARAAGRYCGIPSERLHFLDMPFYETGTVRKKPLGQADVDIVTALLREVEPHQVYAAGDLSDPHGTHRVCLDAIFRAMHATAGDPWQEQCELWLYRGAWQEWEPEKIEMAVPISPNELMRKRQAIFKHESQKDSAVFPGSDPREFWQRAEDRNRATAALYDRLGLAEYEAIEAFVKWDGTGLQKPGQ